MPEVCEVALTALYLKRKLKNKELLSVTVLGGRYQRHGLPSLNIVEKNKTLKIIDINSKGKFIWFEMKNMKTNKKVYLLNTLGLEGRWGFIKKKHSNISFKVKSKSGNKYILYFSDSRNFGTIKFTDKKKDLDDKLNYLGDDFLKVTFTNKEFYNRIKDYLIKSKKRYDQKIVKVLMNQTKNGGLGSGLGNYLVPEILYRAKISPHTTIGELLKSRSKINTLAKTIKYVVKLCYLTNKTGYIEELGIFLKKHRERVKNSLEPDYHKNINIKEKEFCYQVYRKKKDPKDNKVIGEEIIKGRTTYWVPNIQK